MHRVAARKLEQLNAATVLDTLRVPPGNRLEALTHDRQGQHSIRVNDQWRVCFVWRDGDAYGTRPQGALHRMRRHTGVDF